jgi:hypothetical protein
MNFFDLINDIMGWNQYEPSLLVPDAAEYLNKTYYSIVPKEENSMEVKIDADELCDLRKRANTGKVGMAMIGLINKLGFSGESVMPDEVPDFILAKFKELEEKAAKPCDIIQHDILFANQCTSQALQSMRSAEDKLTKMTKERDWWRGECFYLAESLNGRTSDLDSHIARAQSVRSGWVGDWVRRVEEMAARDNCSLD